LFATVYSLKTKTIDFYEQENELKFYGVPSGRLQSLATSMTNLRHPQRSRVASCASQIYKPVVSTTSFSHQLLGLPLPLAPPQNELGTFNK